MSQTIDVDLINAFWQAARDALQMMGNLTIKRRSVTLKPDNSCNGTYYAVIGLSQGLIGNVAVDFTDEAATQIAAALFGEHTDDEELLMDAVGEICNLTAGGGKVLLTQGDYRFEISPPTNLRNHAPEPLTVFNPAGTVCIVIRCCVAGQKNAEFAIELAFQTESRAELEERKRRSGYVLDQPSERRG